MCRLKRLLLPFGVITVGLGVIWAVVGGVDRLGLFELEFDANAAHNAATSPPDDWQTINTPGFSCQLGQACSCPAGTSCTVRTGALQDLIGTNGANDDIFTGGGSKDNSDISQWK